MCVRAGHNDLALGDSRGLLYKRPVFFGLMKALGHHEPTVEIAVESVQRGPTRDRLPRGW